MRCPNCQTTNIGLIGEKRFYCWNCLVEVSRHQNQMEISDMQASDVLSLDELFVDEAIDLN